MSDISQWNYGAVFGSLNGLSEEFPVSSVEVNKWLVSLEGCSDQEGIGRLPMEE